MKGEFEPDPELDEEQRRRVSALSAAEISDIDAALLSGAIVQWRKVAMIVGLAMMQLKGRFSGVPDLFYAERVRELVKSGALESQGNLRFMRYSEVRRVQMVRH